jgi:hypothetical protein
MREFSRKKFASRDTLRGTSKDINDPARDTKWLSRLIEVKNFFQKDPISLAVIYRSFPNLANLFITALAATADYNHTEDDDLNNQTLILKEMFDSFGKNEDGSAAFQASWAMQNFMTGINLEKAIKKIGLPSDSPPATPDVFHLRLGGANFYVPPISISVNTAFKTGSLTGGSIRQKSSPKFNSGYRETTINLKLYFPNYEEIWGMSIDDASKIVLNSDFKLDFSTSGDESKIDKFLSSLRGLVAAFKYAPILPIKNHYLNSVHGITGVALSSMNVSTVPDYPFALVVDLELLNFNHKPFLPMIKDFNQAVKWGHFRQYMGKAAGAMYNYVSEEFVLQKDVDEAAAKDATTANGNRSASIDEEFTNKAVAEAAIDARQATRDAQIEANQTLTTNIYKSWQDGKNLTLYVPAKIQSKIYTPDESSFRTPEEVAQTDVGNSFWEGILKSIGLDVNESSDYRRNLDSVLETARNTSIPTAKKKRLKTIVDVALAGSSSTNIKDKVYQVLALEFIARQGISDKAQIEYLKNPKPSWELELPSSGDPSKASIVLAGKNSLYTATNSTKGALQYEIEKLTDDLAKSNKLDFKETDPNKYTNPEWLRYKEQVEKPFIDQFNLSLYERFFSNSDIISLLEAARNRSGSFSFREWDVPMLQVDLDPKSVIVNAVNVTIGNNLAKMQLQMQDEPTYQHIGGRDSYINLSMTVFGEKELTKLKKTFDFISGLARLEHAAGVIGFLGIKNIVTALCGIKYVMPLSYNVDTIPNFPHVYSVQLSLVDFDVYQQKREHISSEQQRKFIEDFKSKRNPFLRLKQNWSVFNGYPDMPLQVKDEDGNVVGCLDPDFYFRSFEMFDNDVVNSIVDPNSYALPISSTLESDKLTEEQKAFANVVKERLIQNNGTIQDIKQYLIDQNNLKPAVAMKVFRYAIFDEENDTKLEQDNLNASGNLSNKYPTLWKDFIAGMVDELGEEHAFEDLKFDTKYGQVRIGDLISGSKEQMDTFTALVASSEFNIQENKLPYFNPDDANFFGIVQYIPAADSAALNKIPAIYQTPDAGFILGYVDENDGNFYIAADSLNMTKNSSGGYTVNGVNGAAVSDTSVPNRDQQDVHTGVTGMSSLDQYQNPMSSGETDQIESISTNGTYKGTGKHWQKMMLDTQYRDISGRMIRAFPTYMLWLIDEGGYSYGMKLFDNFYGLQSIIDFSIVQSEDILGDTLLLRLSNAYSKLTKPELTLTEIVNNQSAYGVDTSLSEGTASVVDVLLNASRNISNHFETKYVTEIENIRLRPGVRVHLRGGYGANPNSLQTLFNGVITTVEQGEIVTVTAQSDAIELSPIINSTNKKGDSGKIDGGINTGLWLSEPRDLMIRLLSMGSSRVREGFALATRGTVFSENKFGIRHFGSILYEPLTKREQVQAQNYRDAVINGLNSVAKNPVTGTWNQIAGAGMNALTGGTVAAGLDRAPVWGAMSALWANFSTQRDLEIFKRNIYPGNGIGIGQFMGGDIDDGWASLAAIDTDKLKEDNFSYLDRLTDSSWARLVEQANNEDNLDASNTLSSLTAGNKIVDSSRATGTTQVLSGVIAIGATAAVATLLPGVGLVAGTAAAATSGATASTLTKVFAGRGMTNIFATMGLVSTTDDDLYDEVSFRAQTYMRSVWDMFQLCARLLPNYIVAVRPFEDRSTVFYGKPHWLYTSGVVPISTGFALTASENQDDNGPTYSLPDGELSRIMDKINKETNSVADSSAFKSLQESTVAESIAKAANDSLSFSNLYKAGGALKGKIINFRDTNRNKYYEKGVVKAILPINKGKAQVGFHLPFGNNDPTTMKVQEDHVQIPNLPLRFSYPFFTNRSSGTLPSLDFDKILKNTTKYEDFEEKINNVVELARLEKQIINVEGGKTKLVSKGQNEEYVLNENFSFASAISLITDTAQLSGTAAYDPSGINIEDGITGLVASPVIEMPLPIVHHAGDFDLVEVNGKYEFNEKLKEIYAAPDNAYNRQLEYPELKLDFTEWGMPATAEEEQFYIAMKWPYDIMGIRTEKNGITASDDVKNAALRKFKDDYGLNSFELTGTPADYKKRRVLVYNPDSQKAVVCAPAYFLWGETDPDGSGKIEAIVSPDAAFYLGMLINKDGEINGLQENYPENWRSTDNSQDAPLLQENSWEAISMAETSLPNLMYTFVEDGTPLGVVTSTFNPANKFFKTQDQATAGTSEEWVVGFGSIGVNEKYTGEDRIATDASTIPYTFVENPFTLKGPMAQFSGIKTEYTYDFSDTIKVLSKEEYRNTLVAGGNYSDYFSTLKSSNLEDLKQLDEDKLYDQRENADKLKSVYDPIDPISVIARGFYDETFDGQVKVIAGNGRNLKQAEDIWNQFRWGYHTYGSVKSIFAEMYSMDPDDENEGNPLIAIFNLTDKTGTITQFGADNNASAEFSTLLGADWLANDSGTTSLSKNSTIAQAAMEYIDNGFDGFDNVDGVRTPKSNQDKGVVDLFNKSIQQRAQFIQDTIKNNIKILNVTQSDGSEDTADTGVIDPVKLSEEYLANIKTPKQLFLLLVGLFRQRLWSDPYSRAWLVLKPNRKRWVFGDDRQTDAWSFGPVDKAFQAFIDFNSVISKTDAKWKGFLSSNASEGTSSSNWWSGAVEDVDNFWDKNIGPIFTAFSSSLSSLANMFRMSMMQLGQGLSKSNDATRQANILNKAYNDSLYYSLGRPGTLLRAVDNPFTREYGEPVVEIREPFQKVHYISSFSHILTNGIQENLSGVATQITAVSDGQYPVTVALDKAAPAERQVEKTVETGIYFDNARGSGFFGILHPFFHPMETVRGITKAATGEPDELTARRIGLAHLKESIKDVYNGEITVVGNADIRPHDLVYLADVYERMYGIFEVEQVVHHFTPEMGFVTSITPNAFVTVNDPARWFMSSWISAHFSMQNLRNDTRVLMSTSSRNSLVQADGTISLDDLSQALQPQLVGGLMYTHGHSALLKDIAANAAADALPDVASQLKAQIKANTGRQEGSLASAITISVAMPLATTVAAAVAIPAGPVAVGAVVSAGAIASDLAWSAWKWTRDNVLDQHGCYVQYLNRNGQPMDAGLSFNQGMVVGKHASTKLIPTLMGTRTETRTKDGYSYIRSDDLFKSMGWKEQEIANLVRYISLENAIVNTEMLKYSGIGPEKTGLNQAFRVVGLVTNVVDGDTFDVVDILSDQDISLKTFRVRFDGLNTSELAETGLNGRLNGTEQEFDGGSFFYGGNRATPNVVTFNPTTAGGKALRFTAEAVVGRLVVLRINPDLTGKDVILTEDDLEAGGSKNVKDNYSKAIKGKGWTGEDRYMATIFYKTDESNYFKIVQQVREAFKKHINIGNQFESKVKSEILGSIYQSSIFNRYFDKMYDRLYELATLTNRFESTGDSDPLKNISNNQKKIFSTLVSLLVTLRVYEKASEWPMNGWDEYYDDGSPLTLNWELVINGLAKVYNKGLLLNTSPAQPSTESQTPMPIRVN